MTLETLDPVLVLTPLLVFALVLLLGFAGCDRVFRLDPVAPPSPPALTLRLRAPSALAIRQLTFQWDPPNTPSGSETLTKPDPSGFEEDENLFDHALPPPPDYGSWTVKCRVVLQGGTAQGAEGMGTFDLDVSFAKPVATFRTVGGAPDLAVMFAGLGEG